MLGHGGIHDQVHDLAEGAEGIGECLHPLPLAFRTGDRRHQGGVIAITRVLPRPGLIGSLHPVDGGVEPQERGQTRGLPGLERIVEMAKEADVGIFMDATDASNSEYLAALSLMRA